MVFVSSRKSIPKSISHSGGIPGRPLGKTSRKPLTTRTNSMGGTSESKSLTITIVYKHPIEFILQIFRQEMI